MGLAINPLESQVEKIIWNALVFHADEVEANESYLIDAVRCRRDAVYESTFSIPMFSIYDRIEKAEKKLHALNCIS